MYNKLQFKVFYFGAAIVSKVESETQSHSSQFHLLLIPKVLKTFQTITIYFYAYEK